MKTLAIRNYLLFCSLKQMYFTKTPLKTPAIHIEAAGPCFSPKALLVFDPFVFYHVIFMNSI